MTLEMCPSITFLLFSVVSLVFFEKISETLYRNRCFITKHLDVRRILTIFSVVETLISPRLSCLMYMYYQHKFIQLT